MNKKKLYMLVFLIAVIFLITNSCTMKIIKKSGNKKKLLIDRINQYNENIKSFKGTGYAIVKEGKTAKTFRLEVIFNNDYNSYRILIKDFIFQKPIVVLMKNDGTVIVYDYLRKKESRYSNISKIFKKVLNFDIPNGNVFIQTLGLRVPIINDSKAKLLDDNSIMFNLNISSEIIYMNDNLPVKLSYLNNSNVMSIQFNKFRRVDSLSLPSKIIINVKNTSLEVSYKSIEINKDYSSEMKIVM